MKQASYRPSRMAALLLSLAVHVVLLSCGGHATDVTSNCKLSVETPSERKVLSRLEPLTKRNFTVEKTNAESKESYTYTLQICGDAGGVPGAGVIQVDNKGKKTTIVGLYNSTQAIGGSDWVMLIYKNGEKYDGHCNKELRKAIIMISCDRNANPGPLEVVLEDRDRQQDCFYLFELDSSAVCPAVESHLGAGSILLIILVCVVAAYLIGGFLYQRLVVGAKGMEQFPNYTFWAEVGNMAADGCDFVCRSRSREEAPAYRSAPTEPLDEGPEERDDHLLPM